MGLEVGDGVNRSGEKEQGREAEHQQRADFTATCYDGSDFHLADQRGKATFINFWATYCTPCIQELPHIDEL